MKFDRDADSQDDLKTPAKSTRAGRKSKSVASRKVATKPGAKAGEAAASTELKKTASVKGIDWVELSPAGISVATAMGRPVLILKDATTGDVLPVWMQPLDAGIAMAELSHSMGATPLAVTRQLLALLKYKVRSCTFTEMIGHHQFAQIELDLLPLVEGNESLRLRVRADEAMSFCLQANAKFYSTREFMARCRDLDVDLAKLEHSLVEGTLPALQAEIEISSKKHPYVM